MLLVNASMFQAAVVNMAVTLQRPDYVTFEFLDGSRKEFGVDARHYAYLAERDKGTLHSKGDWFLGFDRHLKQVR